MTAFPQLTSWALIPIPFVAARFCLGTVLFNGDSDNSDSFRGLDSGSEFVVERGLPSSGTPNPPGDLIQDPVHVPASGALSNRFQEKHVPVTRRRGGHVIWISPVQVGVHILAGFFYCVSFIGKR
ncbi:hypothetical protein CEXT_538701 [Caerostris extrusa]|uniref:Uncharacterized protein n=1 Tax=Caerostris extrusa TaxID=172846 RepID=A0AAV4Y4A5_CAEEX|nr:hypothetical protein CEXT_538701 [Caerostris extrusa]